jgi:hypothetical protein
LLPVSRGHVDPAKGINTAGFPEHPVPETLVGVDLEVKDFKGFYKQLPTVDRNDYVIPKDGHLAFKPRNIF